ncbi:DUF2235 domain-containing protein, partial [Dyella sp. ASV21]|uniref:T6SS phospholipase effector Tle1-like catalytic domain-containing protein n=1 Tax=Dyella sp. ASV21 TaxID=2795114 RepID=UPI0018EC2C26
SCGARLIGTHEDLLYEDDSGLPLDTRDAPPVTAKGAAETKAPAATASLSSGQLAGLATSALAAIRRPAVHVVFRIAVFNEGTGNNIENSRAFHAKCAPAAVDMDKHPDILAKMARDCGKANGMEGASFEGGETNVNRLRDLYPVTEKLEEGIRGEDGRLTIHRRVYVPGIGTDTGKKDSVLGSAFGYASTGVAERAMAGLRGVVAEIKAFARENPGIVIDAVEFDQFGFSRGAAASRHLAWLIHHGEESLLNRSLRDALSSLAWAAAAARTGPGPMGYGALSTAGDSSAMNQALDSRNLPLKPGWSKKDLRIRFIGLFDCVAAIGIPDNADNDPVHLYLPRDIADKVVHLAARDECRLNFASNPVGFHTTIWLPGVHSDLGGGYAMWGWEHLLLGRPFVYTCPKTVRNPLARPSENPAWKQAFKDMMDNGWHDYVLFDAPAKGGQSDNRLRIQMWNTENAASKVALETTTAAVTLQRWVRGEYQLVTLRIMHALAVEAGVPFNRSPDDVPQLALPEELKPIHAKLLAYARNEGRGKCPLSDEEEALLKRRYLHHSSHWNPQGWVPGVPQGRDDVSRDPEPSMPIELGFPMRPAPKRKRLVFDPLPGH